MVDGCHAFIHGCDWIPHGTVLNGLDGMWTALSSMSDGLHVRCSAWSLLYAALRGHGCRHTEVTSGMRWSSSMWQLPRLSCRLSELSRAGRMPLGS